jgi:hypothetical protein
MNDSSVPPQVVLNELAGLDEETGSCDLVVLLHDAQVESLPEGIAESVEVLVPEAVVGGRRAAVHCLPVQPPEGAEPLEAFVHSRDETAV